jgi:preprotein translocase subunit Sss1
MNEDWTIPSRKWFAARVTAIGAMLVGWAEAGEWSTTLTIIGIGIVTEGAVSYLIPNRGSDA